LEQLDYLNNLLFKELNTNAFRVSNEKVNEFQFSKNHIKAIVQNTCEGEIDTGKMMKTLIFLVTSIGVEIRTGCEVISITEQEKEVEIVCKNPILNSNVVLKAASISICNNAFAKNLLPTYDVIPGRGQVLITKPISGLPFKGIFHFDKGYYYFREYNGSVLFGGGRNLDFEKETTTSFELNHKIQDDLIAKLYEIIIPNYLFEVDLQWTGIMAFGASKRPIVEQHSKRIFIGVRMGGMGIAIGSEVGNQLADLIASKL
jgi:gamma-glutamylputrescine oxidase